jgi:putative DNA primase/helicase
LCWLTKAKIRKNKNIKKFPANNRTVNDMIEALKSVCLLDDDVQSGTWLGRGEMPPRTSLIFAQNCVYNWRTGEKYPCSSRWFNQSCVSTVIDEDAPDPERWLRFLRELWDNDEKSMDLLHEFMGVTLTLDTSFQKILLVSGPPRAGKGTIFDTLAAIHGEQNAARPTTDSLTERFGLQPLIGKPLAIISDARFVGRNIQTTIERLLNISGEDAVTIDKKNRDAVTLKLPTRIIVGINGLPKFPDNSGALANRFLPLKLTKTFLGREDRHLREALLQELPGILKLMLEGLRRLHRQGFTKPAYQAGFIQDVEELGSPLRAFVRERCELGADKLVMTDHLWRAWLAWNEDSSFDERGRPLFGRNLKASFPEITKSKKSGKNCYVGIGLVDETQGQ